MIDNILYEKVPSDDKSDITIKAHNFNTDLNPTLGLGIKSRLNKLSTLLNASVKTNFIYKICGNMDDQQMDCINSMFVEKSKNGVIKNDISVAARMEYINRNGLSLTFEKMNETTFQNNLILIDSDLPKIVSFVMLEYYLNDTNNILDALNSVALKNPLNYDSTQGLRYYHYKFKKLLAAFALGMLPSEVWTGRTDADGGYIIEREDGKVLGYHLYNGNDFADYLLNNTLFDCGSAVRHEYATIKKIEGKYYIALNLQIRLRHSIKQKWHCIYA